MKITIDQEIAEKHGMNMEEAMLLLVLSSRDLNTLLEEMYQKGMVTKSLVGTIMPDPIFEKEVERVTLLSENSVPRDENIEDLAKTLIELFPRGKKPGSTKSWRGNKRDIKIRLQKFFKLYGNEYSYEEIIEATKRYIDSFNGDYTYMRVLEYFIHKNVYKEDAEGRRSTEEVSELANFLEDKELSTANNWQDELI